MFLCSAVWDTTSPNKYPHRFWIPHVARTVIFHCVHCRHLTLQKVQWYCNFWLNCVGNDPGRKWLVNHCPLSHFAHGELSGLGTHWVVAVLNDSCGAQCLKLSSNVWHMVCVSLWHVTLVALNSPVAADWLCERWGTGKGQSMNLKKETTQCEQLSYQMALTYLLRSPLQYLALASLLSGNV